MKKIFIFISVLLFIYSCDNMESGTKDASFEAQENIEDLASEESQESDKNVINLPSPLRIINMFNNSGLEFTSGLVNPTQNSSNYVTKFKQKLNFGIYTADLSYCVLNEQKQLSLEYLKALKNLSQRLWKRDVFSTVDLGKTVESNIQDKDKLLDLLSNFQLEIDKYLEMNGVVLTGTYIFASAFVEILYLGFEANRINKNKEFDSIILKQPIILESLIEILNKNRDLHREGALAFLEELEKMVPLFDDLVKAIKENSPDSKNKSEALRLQILNIRTSIVS